MLLAFIRPLLILLLLAYWTLKCFDIMAQLKRGTAPSRNILTYLLLVLR